MEFAFKPPSWFANATLNHHASILWVPICFNLLLHVGFHASIGSQRIILVGYALRGEGILPCWFSKIRFSGKQLLPAKPTHCTTNSQVRCLLNSLTNHMKTTYAMCMITNNDNRYSKCPTRKRKKGLAYDMTLAKWQTSQFCMSTCHSYTTMR